jgi:hypothetical protein
MTLGTFLDLHYLVRDQTMRLAVDGLSRFLVRGLGQAEDLAALLVCSETPAKQPIHNYVDSRLFAVVRVG